MPARKMLVVRLGSMGDVIHTLPAAATLKHSLPLCHLAWVIDPKWAVLLDGNPFVDEVIPLDRRKLRVIWAARHKLRAGRFDTVVDFQGLIKSAVVASLGRPERIYGFHRSQVREPLAALFYSHTCLAKNAHVVDRNVELAETAAGANPLLAFPLPPGEPEGQLPEGPFVLASPIGGWPSKQWPLASYGELARQIRRRLQLPLVVNGAPNTIGILESLDGCRPHLSGIPGLIDATRRAAAVVGIDSGPLHLAAALGKPGVAIFGPTDPERNGPYGHSITVLRDSSAGTSYKRRDQIDESMRAITPKAVCEALEQRLRKAEGLS